MPQEPHPYRLLVEGKNDVHVIRNLCLRHRLPIPSIEPPKVDVGDAEGITALLDKLETVIKSPRLNTLGIVVDADPDPGLDARWQSVRDRLLRAGVGLNGGDIPAAAPGKGWVSQPLQLEYDVERIGIWLMPDNRVTGILEDFVAHLIAPDDRLLPKAEQILDELEAAAIQPYSSVERPKARIHTWLAWQSPPGQPMGLAITASVLRDDTPLALEFIQWFNNLYGAMGTELSTVPFR